MSQILLREVNKYNNSIGYFSKNKKLSYSSRDIYIASSDKNKPIILNFEECRSATALYGCNEKIKTIYLNIIMQAIETNVPFSIVNTIFIPEEIEDKIKYKLSKTSYKYPVYNIEKEDLENDKLSMLTREASMIVHFHDSSQHEKMLLNNTFDRSLLNHFNGKQNNNCRLPYTLMIMAFLEEKIIHNPNYIAMGRSLGIYNFFSNNELDHNKLANSRVSVLLEDKYNADYKETVDMFQLRQVNQFDPYVKNLKEHLKSTDKLNRNYKIPLSTNNSYIIREDNDITKLVEIKKFY